MLNKKTKIVLLFWSPVIFWMAFIFFLSSMPGYYFPNPPFPYFDKIIHFVEYSILGVLLMRAFLHSNFQGTILRLSLFSCILASLFAISDEWHQTFVPDRSGEWSEVLCDVIFSMIAIYFYTRTSRISDIPTSK